MGAREAKSLGLRFLENWRAACSRFFPFLFFSFFLFPLRTTSDWAAARPRVSGQMKTAGAGAHICSTCVLLPLSSTGDAGTGGRVDASVAANRRQILASISRQSPSQRVSDISQPTETFPWFHRSRDSAISQPDNPHIFSLTWKIIAVSLDLPQTPPQPQNPPLEKKNLCRQAGFWLGLPCFPFQSDTKHNPCGQECTFSAFSKDFSKSDAANWLPRLPENSTISPLFKASY